MGTYILYIESTLAAISYQEMNSLFEPVQNQVNFKVSTLNCILMENQLYRDREVCTNIIVGTYVA